MLACSHAADLLGLLTHVAFAISLYYVCSHRFGTVVPKRVGGPSEAVLAAKQEEQAAAILAQQEAEEEQFRSEQVVKAKQEVCQHAQTLYARMCLLLSPPVSPLFLGGASQGRAAHQSSRVCSQQPGVHSSCSPAPGVGEQARAQGTPYGTVLQTPAVPLGLMGLFC